MRTPRNLKGRVQGLPVQHQRKASCAGQARWALGRAAKRLVGLTGSRGVQAANLRCGEGRAGGRRSMGSGCTIGICMVSQAAAHDEYD